MPPKVPNVPASEGIEEPVVEEEEEEGEGNISFHVSVSGVSNLPCDLETCVDFSGLCRENRSSLAPTSSSPACFVFPKDRFIRRLNQALYDDLVSRQLIVCLRDAGNDGAIIGQASLSCLPLLHDQLEVGGEMELTLTPAYHKKWWPELDLMEQESANKDKKASAKAKGKDKKNIDAPVEPSLEVPKRPTDFVPPPTVITVHVRVDSLVGPLEDRGAWTTLSVNLRGVFALPERLTMLGLLGPADDVDGHQLKYHATILGESVGEGSLARPVEERLEPASAEDTGEALDKELSREEWHDQQERFSHAVRFKESIVRYRGARFLKEFRSMLNSAGGVWLYLAPQEKAPSDPKKPNPPEVAALARHFSGKAWVDLRAFMRPGSTSIDKCCGLVSASPREDVLPGELALQDARAFVRLALALRFAAVPSPHPCIGDLRLLAPALKTANKFPSSIDAAAIYREAVETGFTTICRDRDFCAQGVASAVMQLKKNGDYEELRESIRGAVVRVFRERLRKDTRAVPGRTLEGAVRDELMSSTYGYLKETAVAVLDEIRLLEQAGVGSVADGEDRQLQQQQLQLQQQQPQQPPQQPQQQQQHHQQEPNGAELGSSLRGGFDVPSRRGSLPSGESGLDVDSPSTVVRSSACMMDEVAPRSVALEPVAVLGESPGAQRAREVIAAAGDVAGRNARLAFEAELVGNWRRAAELLQSRLLLEEIRTKPREWIAYAKFCARARGRQAAAEEALRQAVQLIAASHVLDSQEDGHEVDMMLACLLLDRGRHGEAVRVFRELHDKDLADPMFNFFLGLALFLTDEHCDESSRLLEAAAKPRSWFQGLYDDKAVADKLQAFRAADGDSEVRPYVQGLEKLLDFGLPSLVFTFIDQCATLSEAAVACEPIALIDARASALDRDFATALTRLEQLTAPSVSQDGLTGQASQEAWRLQGECLFQLGDMDRALHSFNYAMSFEKKFEEPAVFIRLGSVLVAKKRWKQAREAYLRSIQLLPTAEAWSGVAYAEYRSDELHMCYEALCEANVLDNERPDVWALLTLVHLRLENWMQADHSFRQCLKLHPDCEELLLEVASEYAKGASGQCQHLAFAEVAARQAMELRDSGHAHCALAEALSVQGQVEQAILEAQIAMKLLIDQSETRKAMFDRALKWCEELGDVALTEALHAVQQRCDEEASKSP